MKFTAYRVGMVPFSSATMESAVDWLLTSSERSENPRSGVSVRLANAYCVALADGDEAYRDVLQGPGINFPDGTPVWGVMSALANAKGDVCRPGRVRGPSFFRECLDKGRDRGVRHFFLGGTDASLADMIEHLDSDYPGIKIAGYYAPPFGPVDEAFITESLSKITDADPDIVWIGLGTPKQDFASSILTQKTGLNCVGVGAAFDFVAGSVREAPKVFQKTGTEWLFRFASEPKRLWRRYTIGNFIFAKTVIANLVTARRVEKDRCSRPQVGR